MTTQESQNLEFASMRTKEDLVALATEIHGLSTITDTTTLFLPPAVLAYVFIRSTIDDGFYPVLLLIFMVFATVWVVFIHFSRRKRLRLWAHITFAVSRLKNYCGQHAITISEEDLTCTHETKGVFHYPWSDVVRVHKTHQYIFVFYSKNFGVEIKLQDVSPQKALDAFQRVVELTPKAVHQDKTINSEGVAIEQADTRTEIAK